METSPLKTNSEAQSGSCARGHPLCFTFGFRFGICALISLVQNLDDLCLAIGKCASSEFLEVFHAELQLV